MQTNSRSTLILAAGQNTRISELAFDRPKTLLTVNGQSLLLRLCHMFGSISERIVIVAGSNADAIREHLRGEALPIDVIDTPVGTALGSAYSLRQGLSHLADAGFEGNVVIIESDIILSEWALEAFNRFPAVNKFILMEGVVKANDDKIYSINGALGVSKAVPAQGQVLGKFLGLFSLDHERWSKLNRSLADHEGEYPQHLGDDLLRDAVSIRIPVGLAEEVDTPEDYARVLSNLSLAARLISSGTTVPRPSVLTFSGPLKRLVGVYDPIGAKLVQRSGFDGLWLGSFQIALSRCSPDNWTYDPGAALQVAQLIRQRDVLLPAVLDAGAGFPTAREAQEVLTSCSALGISAVCVDDQGDRRTCSLDDRLERAVVPVGEFTNRIAQLVAAARGRIQIIARTESLNLGRRDAEVAERLRLALEAGASAVIPHYVGKDKERIRAFLGKYPLPGPVILIPTGLLEVPLKEFREMGCNAIVYANLDLRLRFQRLLDAYSRSSSLGLVDEDTRRDLADPRHLTDFV